MITTPTVPSQFIKKQYTENITGRVLELPAKGEKSQTPILLIYGHHSSLERIYSLAQVFNEYGPVTVPDLPGFGGMPSLGTVGKAPSLDHLADFLAAFIRTRYPGETQFIVCGMSLGFVVATRMLQRHPDLTPKVKHLISLVGFAHYDDFLVSTKKRRFFARTARLMAKQLSAQLFSGIILRKPFIAATYHLRAHNHPKMKGYSWKERNQLIDFEVTLWRTNEVVTYFTLMAEMLMLDLTTQKIALPVEHIAVSNDQYFDNQKIASHLKQIFTKVTVHTAHMPNHAPTVVEGPEEAKYLIPDSLTHIFFATR